MDTIDHVIVTICGAMLQLPPQALQDLELTGSAPALPSSFAVSKAAQAASHWRHSLRRTTGTCAPAAASR